MTNWDEAEQRVEKANELFEHGRWQEALTELKAAIAINPYNGSWHYNLGLTYGAMDRVEDAIASYRKAIEIDPDDIEALTALGLNCNRAEQFDEAIAAFERVESLEPSYEPCYCNRIISYCEKGDHEKAEEMFYLAREYREKCPVCLYHIGSSFFARGIFERALWCWQQVLHIDPDHAQVHARIAEAYWARGQLPEARTHFIEELRSAPGDLDVMLDLGELLVEMRDLVPAGEKFRQVLELSPDESAALFHLGSLALMEGKLEDALDLFRRTLRADRTYPGAHLKIAHIYQVRNERNEALFHANCELAQQTNDEPILTELGNLFMDLGQTGPAEVTFKRVLLLNPRSADACHNLAVTLMMSQRIDEGIEQARRTLRIAPKHMLAMHNLAVAYLSKKDFVRARFWLREAMDIAPDDAQLRQVQAQIRIRVVLDRIRRMPARLLRRAK